MNEIIALILFLILVYFSLFNFETFYQTTSSGQQTSAASGFSYFKISSNDKNLINKFENEEDILKLKMEEENMKNDVKKIVDEANKVLSYTELNMQHIKDIKFNNQHNSEVNSESE